MHWQEAILKSKVKRAVRVTEDGRRVFRHWDGAAFIELVSKAGLRSARPQEATGYLDWEPDELKL